ncbi:MAG: PKD domain-containing protein [Chlorobi bacterium]|nr:PKD domain-containing protein [Chlorobiota bacterium]
MVKGLKRFLVVASLSIWFNLAVNAQTTMGTEFWLMFLDNFGFQFLSLFISSDRNVTGTITVPAVGFVQNFNVPANGNIRINLPTFVVRQAIHIVASDTISVWAANLVPYTSEITVVLPRSALGNHYVVMSHDLASTGDDVIGILAVENGTQVEILKPGSTIPTIVNLNKGDVHYIRGSRLTGTVIKSVYSSQGSCKPIAVFAGNTCGNICVNGTFACCCDHIYEQMFPVETWGKRFYVVPLQTRAHHIIRVAAFYNNTVVTANGTVVATLNQGQFWEGYFAGPVIIETSEPAQVAQYSTSQDCDGVQADPFYIMIPPIEQTMQYVVFEAIATGSITSYYLNIIVPTASVNNTLLNGVNIGATFTPFPNDPTYSYSVQTLNTGTYILENPDSFIATIYGFGNFESYGYVAGSSAKSLIDFDVNALYGGANCPGDSVMITLEIIGNVNIVRYEWDLGDGTIKYGDTVYHVYTQSDTYTITLNYVTDMNMCGSITKQIWIGPLPINNPLDTDTFCLGQPATVYADTTVPPVYVWSTGDTAPYITIIPTQPEDTIIIFYAGNCDVYDTLIFKTGIIDRQYTIVPSLPACYYDTISVSISANATLPPYNISVSLDTGWLSCNNCQNFLAYYPDSFYAFVTITDQAGCSVTDTLPIPVVKRLIPRVPDTSICEFEDTILITPTFNLTRNPLQYQWTSSNAVIFCDTCQSTTLYVSDSTQLVIQVTDSFGCVYFDTARINALPRPVFAIPDTDVCYRAP